MTDQTRGERNNNPLNIDYHASISWQGQLGVEVIPEGATSRPRFARFSSPLMGLRAGAKLLSNYIHGGANTPRLIVGRWAPPNENSTDGYISEVCRLTGFAADQVMSADAGCLVPLLRAMCHQENGRCLYADDLLSQAVTLALGGTTPPTPGIA